MANCCADNYVTPVQGILVVITLCMAWSSASSSWGELIKNTNYCKGDTWLRGRRWPMLILGGGVINGVVCIVLGATPVFPQNRTFRWFLYYQTGWPKPAIACSGHGLKTFCKIKHLRIDVFSTIQS